MNSNLRVYFDKWYYAVKRRKSRRKYTGEPLEKDLVLHLEDTCRTLSAAVDGTRAAVVSGDPNKVFKGVIGSYGKIKEAPLCVAFLGDIRDDNYQEKTGYLGESFILEATSLGLATCWVAGFFRLEEIKRHLTLADHEEVLAVTPVGYVDKEYAGEEKVISKVVLSSHKRKELKDLCSGLSEKDWPIWIKRALEAARLAPSAVNRQPWRFFVEEEAVIISADSYKDSFWVPKRLDCGIAMLHVEVGAYHEGVEGYWEFLSHPEVAVFRKKEYNVLK